MRKLLIILFIGLTTNLAIAQDDKSGCSITLKSGLTLANMVGPAVESWTFLSGETPANFYANNPAGSNFKTGIDYGLQFDYRFGKHLSLGLGTSYLPKGARLNPQTAWINGKTKYINGRINNIQNYMTVDLPITYYYPIKQNDIFLQGGLFYGFLIDSKEQGDINMDGVKYSYVRDRGANKHESGCFLGGGYIHSFKNSRSSILVEMIWSRTLSHSYDSNMIPGPVIYHNQTISFNIGYRYTFRLKKAA